MKARVPEERSNGYLTKETWSADPNEGSEGSWNQIRHLNESELL